MGVSERAPRPMGVSGRWAQLSWTEAAEALARRPVLILPIGATEPHGPHLPLDTDVRISEAVADGAAAALARRGRDAWVLPPFSYGLNDFGSPFPGNVTVREATLEALLTDVCLSLAQPGIPSGALAEGGDGGDAGASRPAAILLINSHLELAHVQCLRRVSRALAERGPVLVLFADQTCRRWVPTLSEEFQSASCHAGQYETSLMLACAPGTVRADREALPPVHADLAAAMRAGAHTFPEAGAAGAYCGDPAAATPEEGRAQLAALVHIAVTTVVEALGEAQ